MFGNIHAIIRRQNLRKEKTNSRAKTLKERKNNPIANDSDSLEKKHSDKEIQEAIERIKLQRQSEKKQNAIKSVSIVIISIVLVYFLYRYVA